MREASGVAAGLTALPGGGGGVSPLGARFQPDLVKGSGSYSIPLSLPTGPNGIRPDLALVYGSGAGAGIFGLGWSIALPQIERRADRGVPLYDDTDSFALGGSELLVEVGGGRFRPRADSTSSYIEREEQGWRIRSGDGRTLRLGFTDQGQEADGARLFAWMIEQEEDQAGNRISYGYRRDGGRLLIDTIGWSVFKLQFVYESRTDVLRDGRAGFLRETRLRVAGIELHCSQAVPALLRTWRMTYAEAANGMSLLSGVVLSGERNGETVSQPPLDFSYGAFDCRRWDLTRGAARFAPPSLDDPAVQLVDLSGVGRPDILYDVGGDMMRWRNRGDGRFDGPDRIGNLPTAIQLPAANTAFADLDGDGRVELFAVDQPLQLAYSIEADGKFAANPIVFTSRPELHLADPQTRLVDTDGDGVTDLLATGRDGFLVYSHQPGIGWQEPTLVPRVRDLDRFPDVSFGERGVRLADMTGDGLQDMVTIRSGDVCFWPSLGHGRWAERVVMQSPPVLPRNYNDERLFLIDVDGDGCSDVVYAAGDRTLIWLNQSGGNFFGPFEIPVTLGRPGEVLLPADMLGDGMTGFVWSTPRNGAEDSGLLTFRFDAAGKPYLLTRIQNGMGGVTDIAYASTARGTSEDYPQLEHVQMPFAVQVVARIAERDLISGSEAITELSYRGGVYDGREREFRGFSAVETLRPGDESMPMLRTVFSYFQGDVTQSDPRLRARDRALCASLAGSKIYERTAGGDVLRHSSVHAWDARLEVDHPTTPVYFPHLIRSEQREIDLAGGQARRELLENFDFDTFGNVGRRVTVWSKEGADDGAITVEERFSYVANTDAWLIKLPARETAHDGTGRLQRLKDTVYDGEAFTGLALGQATAGLPIVARELALAADRLPAGYTDGVDFAGLGYQPVTIDGFSGYVATTMSVRRDAFGNVIEQRDARGQSAFIDYDDQGLYPVATRNALGHQNGYVFDPSAGAPSRVELANGERDSFTFDGLGRLVERRQMDDTGQDVLTEVWRTDLGTQPVSITRFTPSRPGLQSIDLMVDNAAGLVDCAIERSFYDGAGRQVQQVVTAPNDPDGAQRFVVRNHVAFNVGGKVCATFPDRFVSDLVFAAGLAPTDTRTRYDATGAVVFTEGPGTSAFRYVRDAFSVTRYEGPAAGAFADPHPVGPVARVERFDARGQVIGVEEHAADDDVVVCRYRLTFDGRIEQLLAADGATIASWDYAGAGEAVRITHRDAGSKTYLYDAAGRLVRVRHPAGAELTYAYDTIGRPLSIKTATDSGATSVLREMIYDTPADAALPRFPLGRLTSVRQNSLAEFFTYDRAGRPVGHALVVDGERLALQHEYDLAGHRIATTWPDQTRTDYIRDRSGTVTAIPGVVTAVDYAPDGSLISYAFANGTHVAAPIANGRQTALTLSVGDAKVRALDYGYDAVGRLISVRDDLSGDVVTSNLSYDGLHRLTGWTRTTTSVALPTQTAAYSYAGLGDLQSINEAAPLAFAYGDTTHPGRLTAIAGPGDTASMVYDPAGRLVTSAAFSEIAYDDLDRIRSMTHRDGRTHAFAYDLQGQRAVETTTRAGVEQRTLRLGGLFERSSIQTSRSIFLNDILVAVIDSRAGSDLPTFHVADRQGTTIAVLDSAATVLSQRRTSPFGLALSGTGPRDRFAGARQEDDIGLLQFGARWYDPGIGRFVTPDWYILENPQRAVAIPQGFNLYSYALNNPIAFTDKSGRWFFPLVAMAIGAVVGFIAGLTRGKGFVGSLGVAAETAFTTTVGGALGNAVGTLAASQLGTFFGVMGALNGLYTGARGIYSLNPKGALAFGSDSTWGLLGTSLGNVLNTVNFVFGASYDSHDSVRQNRQVYNRGFGFGNFAFTQGNVISNLNYRTGGLLEHETFHITQNRIFGVYFTTTYVAWLVGGAIVGSELAKFANQPFFTSVEDVAYHDNPWELWAYDKGGKNEGGKLA